MAIDIHNFEDGNIGQYDLSIVQNAVDGGITSKEEIDSIQDFPTAKSLIISGLNQDTFEYLIGKYGSQFEAISFWKNKMVSDLSPLESLNGVQYIHYFFNQRATGLWDMRNNVHLKGLAIYDFSRLHSIEQIVTAKCLDYFSLGNRVWSKMDIESLKPLIHSSVTHFAWWGNKILDNDYMCLAQSRIKELDMNIARFSMDDLARLVASIPDLRGTVTTPYSEGSLMQQGEKTTYYFLCKGKKRLVKGKDDAKLKKYLENFAKLVEKYKV